MLSSRTYPLILCFGFLLSACGENSFSGSTGGDKSEASGDATPKSAKTTEPTEDSNSDVPAGEDPTVDASSALDDSPDQAALLGCVKQWGAHKFTKSQLQNFKTYAAEATGFSSSQIVDSRKTEEPSLVLIKVEGTGFGQTQIQLLNPNGFYCIKRKNVGFSGFSVTKHCQAEIASDEEQTTGFDFKQVQLVGC